MPRRLYPTAKRFGQRVTEARRRLGVSMSSLARSVGISGPFLSDIEKGYRNPSDRVLEGLAEAFGVATEELWPRCPTCGKRE